MADPRKIEKAVKQLEPVRESLTEREWFGAIAEFDHVPKDTVLPENAPKGAKIKRTEEENQNLRDMRKAGMSWPKIARCWPNRSKDSLLKHWALIGKTEAETGRTLDSVRQDNIKKNKRRREEDESDNPPQRGKLHSSEWSKLPDDWVGPVSISCRVELHFNPHDMRVAEDFLFTAAFMLQFKAGARRPRRV